MMYRETVTQAQVLAYVDEFRLLSVIFFAMLLLIPFMRRIHATPPPAAPPGERVDGLRAPGEPPRGVAAVEWAMWCPAALLVVAVVLAG
ncbi:MAG: hypothetical protein ACRD2T_16435, partial [Thermoanaerobaculia bacterium]